jgi:hypothetical protein
VRYTKMRNLMLLLHHNNISPFYAPMHQPSFLAVIFSSSSNCFLSSNFCR